MSLKFSYHEDGTKPVNNEIFVFGSNLSGIHGAGAARAALQYYGAKWGQPIGHYGKSYAIPTKNATVDFTLPLIVIEGFVDAFLKFAAQHPNMQFWVTRVGCGLAGLEDAQVAPLFKAATSNCNFPEEWIQFLE